MRKRIVLLLSLVLIVALAAACTEKNNELQEKSTNTVAVPNVIGLNEDQAKESLKDAELVIGNIEYDVEEDGDKDSVKSQNPAAGTELSVGDKVDLTITK